MCYTEVSVNGIGVIDFRNCVKHRMFVLKTRTLVTLMGRHSVIVILGSKGFFTMFAYEFRHSL